MLEGIGKIKQRTQEIESLSGTNRINVLGIADSESAVVRFLTDTDGIIKDKLHNVQVSTPKGTSWRKIRCMKEDTGICEHCTAANNPFYVLYLWAYVHYKIHPGQNPKLNEDPTADKWSPLKVGTSTYYKEEINQPMVFRSKLGGKDKAIEKAFFEFSDEYGTWCDRDYKWSRKGKELDTTYLLTPKDPSKMSKEIEEVQKSLPALSDYVVGKIRSFDSPSEEIVEETMEEEKPVIFDKKNKPATKELF